MTLADLLAGIAAHPFEGERWLILADWLEDQGDPRADLARLRYQYHYEQHHADFEARRERMMGLWQQGMAPLVPLWTHPLGMSFALVPPGSFLMGSPASEGGRDSDEVGHPVALAEPFFLGVTPVTLGDYRNFVSATGYRSGTDQGDGGRVYLVPTGEWRRDPAFGWDAPNFEQTDRHPVVCVGYDDARAYAAWVTAQAHDGSVFALPDEAQWEYACRAGSTTAYFWGDDSERLKDYAWYRQNASQQTHAVESKRPNAWGLYHMAGHVWEWCADAYDTYLADPAPATGTERRILRGGSWHVTPTYCRAAHRAYAAPTDANSHTGFRLARIMPRGTP